MAQLNAAINEVLKEALVRDKLKAIGFDPMFKTHVEAGSYFKDEVGRWGKMVRATGVTPDAMHLLASAELVHADGHSDYGRALRQFRDKYSSRLSAKATVQHRAVY